MVSTLAISPKIVFRTYAFVTIVLGVVGLDGNAGVTLGAQFQPAVLVLQPNEATPFGPYVVPRIVGTVLFTAGLIALAFARLDDAEARRRSLNRFAAAHVVFGFLFSGIAGALLTPTLPSSIVWGPLVVGVVLSSFAIVEAQGRPRGAASIDALRSQYETQIREAARREERSRLARDLHDAVKQQLFAIQTAAATVAARVSTDHSGALAAAMTVRTSAHEALVEMEALIDQLQSTPMENTGLVDALRRLCEALGFRTGARVDLTVGGLPANTAVIPGTHEALYRFAQEALANAGRHARPGVVSVSLGLRDHRLELSIVDDGVGFDPEVASTGMGRQNMAARARELGGEYRVVSAPGTGTRVHCVVPVASAVKYQRLRGALTWAVASALIGFLLYWAGGTNDQGRPAYLLGLEFLRVFGIGLGLGILLIFGGQLVRAAARYDARFLQSLTRHGNLRRDC